ncbi:MAG: dipicolinate synthase subunit DpsA [Bacillota bacterium]|nr:dipicolinate synthase subunit DpsA [Bacillota bacterium]
MTKIAVCGGDRREIAVLNRLLELGYDVAAYALPSRLLPIDATYYDDAAAAMDEAAALILPMPPLGASGELHNICGCEHHFSPALLSLLPPRAPLLCGLASASLAEAARRLRLRLIETAELDAVALPLAAACAEGALAEAIINGDDLLGGKRALLIGYGRIGRELAPLLAATRQQLTVANRGAERAKQAEQDGYHCCSWPELAAVAAQVDYIYNTVPKRLFTDSVLRLLKPHALIVDLAPTPGCASAEAARSAGARLVRAGGLPGKYAPRYAGRVLADVYPRLLEAAWEVSGDV